MTVRRRERQHALRTTHAIREARRKGTDRALLQHPFIDRTRCMGCGLCVKACPEEGVLEVVFGQARVVHGARCVGHAMCADVCPTTAISVALAEIDQRRDIPAIEDDFQVVDTPGLFLAGEVTGMALVRTAVSQGTAVGREVSRRKQEGELATGPEGIPDLLVVGAGPAGLACVLAGVEGGLDVAWIDQEHQIGGTVAKYPRRKFVMTRPVEFPLDGGLDRAEYTKEELMELWQSIAERQQLPFQGGTALEGLEAQSDGTFRVLTSRGPMPARSVCLAMGRRGTPRRLGVPGEELTKVVYSLLDAQSYAGRRVLVVGGGDSAVEAALGLSSQPGTQVTLSYRRPEFFRLKADNERRLGEAIQEGRLAAWMGTQILGVEPERVFVGTGDGQTYELPNDDVFVLAGGEPPFPLLERCGVSFDPAKRAAGKVVAERGSGLAQALSGATIATLLILLWAVWYREYYVLSQAERSAHEWYQSLRPARNVGLAAGIVATLAILVNLAYLLRRASIWPMQFGALRLWMTTHVVTGIGAGLLALLHCGFAWHGSPGTVALVALGVLISTGAIGRYLYAFLPRTVTGREMALEELQTSLVGLQGEWEGDHPQYREWVQEQMQALVTNVHWSRHLAGRLVGLVASPFRLHATLRNVRQVGRQQGVPNDRVEDLVTLARRSHRLSLATTWHEELRAAMASWRYIHRWVAVLLILVLAIHIVTALRYARIGFGGGA
ncbi:MAG: NAD(P)-binding domain-containing protein [Planctomycetes bacterium]|nr:NAD(P)-binding domain-containing protein [Planctomycetota bacterium]